MNASVFYISSYVYKDIDLVKQFLLFLSEWMIVV